MSHLTPMQQKVLTVLEEHFAVSAKYPTLRDLQAKLGYKSTSPVYAVVERLEKLGYIQRSGRHGSQKKIVGVHNKCPMCGQVKAKGAP